MGRFPGSIIRLMVIENKIKPQICSKWSLTSKIQFEKKRTLFNLIKKNETVTLFFARRLASRQREHFCVFRKNKHTITDRDSMLCSFVFGGCDVNLSFNFDSSSTQSRTRTSRIKIIKQVDIKCSSFVVHWKASRRFVVST